MPVYYDNEVIEAHRRVPRIRKDSAPQYPSDSEEEGYLSRRQESHESYLPHSRSPASHDTFASQSRRLSRSAIPHRRRDSSSEEDRRSPDSHKSRSPVPRDSYRRKSSRGQLDVIPYHDNTGRSSSRASRASRRDDKDYDTDSDSHHSSEDEQEERKKRNKKLLYKGLACITSIAAANNIYQSTKAHELRKKEVRNGELSVTEAAKMRNKGLKADAISLGVAAVCINNVRKGWNRVEAMP
ncbi:hypothetical protein MMC28_000498 [Mycoblastus sanguinarius]|nr:hypothetical protein [Mycoblastus sanguinarius]